MPISSQQHRLRIGVFRFTARDDSPKTSAERYRKNKTTNSKACKNTVTKEIASWLACGTFSILYCTCILLLIISMDVELNPGPCDKACRTYMDRHHRSIETKIQQLFDCMRQHGDTLNIQIDHQFEQLHQILEKMIQVCHEATARVAYTRHELFNMNNTALCPPAVHRRLVQVQLSRSSPDLGPTAKKPKHRPFRGGRRKQGRCIPVLGHSLTRNRALLRGRNLDNCIQVPLTASVIDSPSCSRSFLKFAHINVQSCRNKTVQIHEFITDNEIDVLFMTETWLYDQGDVALVSKCSLKSISVKQLNYQSFEAVEAKLFHSGKSMSFVCLYRPPPSRVNKFTDKMFQDEFSGLVAYLASGTGESVIVGDFNYHFDCTSCPHVKQLQTLFSDNCLTQLIHDPTHCRGHILDWMVVRENNGSVSQCNIPSLTMMPL